MEDCAYLVFLILSWSSGVKRCVRRVDFDEFRRVSGLLRSMGKRMGLNKRRTHHFSTQSSPSRWRISSKTYKFKSNPRQSRFLNKPKNHKNTNCANLRNQIRMPSTAPSVLQRNHHQHRLSSSQVNSPDKLHRERGISVLLLHGGGKKGGEE